MKLFGIVAGACYVNAIAIDNGEKGKCRDNCQSVNRQCTKDCSKTDAACLSKCQRDLDKCITDCDGPGIHILTFDPRQDKQYRIDWYYTSDDNREVSSQVVMNPSISDRTYMCSFQLKNEMYMIGGRGTSADYRNYKVKETELEKLSDLPFSFRDGACAAISDHSALACSPLDNPYGCWKFDGSKWDIVGGTQNDHTTATMAAYQNGAVIIAGYKDRTGSTEFWDSNQPMNSQWSVKTTVKDFEQFDQFSAVEFNSNVYIFGGQTLWRKNNEVFYLHGTWTWDRLPQTMLYSRSGHRTIAQGNIMVTIGGTGDLPIEAWELNSDGTFSIYESDSKYLNFITFPETFSVSSDWGQ